MEINLIAETFKFLILGMSTVFMFLILLVYVLQIQSKIIMKFFPQKSVAENAGGKVARAKSTDNLAVVAAIAATLKTYKK
ncbi:MAG: OadG family protein [Sulfurospirillaceae bacterium]|jgi:oxaloacetate decarboxylase gamma subunit|nr:OadG family protein [Sulfurospirillaceae bacterium]MDD2827338.1 OadG family protein [Sulfurospirillaceae bacterium]